MRAYKTTGVVLRRVNYSEADRILTLLTPDHGKVSAIAKGVRKVKSRLGGSLELFSVVELMLHPGRNLDVVTGATLRHHFSRITEDYERMRRAFLCCEMVDKLTSDNSAPETYDILVAALQSLHEGHQPAVAELYFKLRLLDILGYRPNLKTCMESQQEIQAGKRYFFSTRHGGLVDSDFARNEHVMIGNDHIKLWRLMLSQPLDAVAQVRGVETAARESIAICNDFYDYLFSKRFRSSEL